MRRIVVTGGVGQIAYSLLFRIAAGELLGQDQPIALHILEVPEHMDTLKGVAMELEDCAFPLLKEILLGSDPLKMFKDVDYAFLIGAKPRGPGMERKDLLIDNASIFVSQGKALDRAAARNVVVLVVGNPCNTNCLIAKHHAPSLFDQRFFAMTLLDQHRATALLAAKAGVQAADVDHMTIWGNHSSTLVPDFMHATIKGKRALEVIADQEWLEGEFFSEVQQRGAQVIKARGRSSAASAAHAAIHQMRCLIFPTKKGEWFSCALATEGNPYGIKEGLVFSFPCRSKGGGVVEIVEGLAWDSFLKDKIAITEKELLEERSSVLQFL